MVDLRRRGLLRGHTRPIAPEQRMPWQVDEESFTAQCTRCMACVEACPERIVEPGDGGYPTVNFTRGECTFCQRCVEICNEPVFRSTQLTPWQQTARINQQTCLAIQSTMCRSCEDSCEPEAIRFKPQLSKPAIPIIDNEQCTGCGACISICPNNAIEIAQPASEETTHAG